MMTSFLESNTNKLLILAGFLILFLFVLVFSARAALPNCGPDSSCPTSPYLYLAGPVCGSNWCFTDCDLTCPPENCDCTYFFGGGYCCWTDNPVLCEGGCWPSGTGCTGCNGIRCANWGEDCVGLSCCNAIDRCYMDYDGNEGVCNNSSAWCWHNGGWQTEGTILDGYECVDGTWQPYTPTYQWTFDQNCPSGQCCVGSTQVPSCFSSEDPTCGCCPEVTFTLTVIKDGTGSGTVTNTGINCGGDCSENFPVDTVVTLAATPDFDSGFTGWSGGGCSGAGSCVVTMDADKIVTATFNEEAIVVTPTVTTNPATNVQTDSAQLNGDLLNLGGDSSADVWFEWDTDPGTNWVSPTGHIDSAAWTGEMNAYDDNTGTYAQRANIGALSWGEWFELTHEELHNNGLRFLPYASYYVSGHQVEIEVYDGVWQPFYLGGFTNNTWNEQYSSSRAITKVRARFYNGHSGGSVSFRIYEFDFGEASYINNNYSLRETMTGTGGFNYSLAGLSLATTYYFRAAAENSVGRTYGNGSSFTTQTEISTLTVTTAGTGLGIVVSSDGYINCGTGGTDCSKDYTSGTSVTLTAYEDAGSTFDHWSGACSGTGSSCILTMDVDKTVTATFALAGPENCCNDIDDDGDGYENGEDSGCQNDVNLAAGSNSICWWTRWNNYLSNSDYYSGWFTCPTGYYVGIVNIYQSIESSLYTDYFYMYDTNVIERYKENGIYSGDVNLSSYNTQGVKFRFTSDSSSNFDGVKVNTITCSLGAKPDFVIEDIWNEDNTIYYRIKNQGGGSAPGDVWSCLWVDGGWITNDRVYAENLESGESATESFNYGWACSDLEDEIKVQADWTDAIEETIEGNNIREETWQCPTFTLLGTITGTGSGIVNVNPSTTYPPYHDYTTADGGFTEIYTPDTSVVLTPTADAGSEFDGWTGNCLGIGPCTISITADRNVTATFNAVVGLPTVTTNPATNVEETTATLNGNIVNTGGENCNYIGFDYDTDSGEPYSSDWISPEEEFLAGVDYDWTSSIYSKGELYYFRFKAHNSAGLGYGGEETFLTKPDPPTNITATAISSTEIDLTWVIGEGADYTEIVGKESTCPAGFGDATYFFGFQSGTDATHTGLTPNTTYCYAFRSEAEEGGLEQYSDYSTVTHCKCATTLSGALCIPGETEITMDYFPSSGYTTTTIINAPPGGIFTGGTITKLYATGDFNSADEYFNAYVENNQINANYRTGYTDCTYHEVDSNISINSYIDGKSSFELKVVSSLATDIGNLCPDTAIKVKWCLDLSSSGTHTLTVTKAGDGLGTVEDYSWGWGKIDCGPECLSASADYTDGSGTRLSTQPEPDSYFDHWEGDCASYGAADWCDIAFDSDKNVIAVFSLIIEAVCDPGEIEVTMDNFASDRDTKIITVNAPSGEQFTGGAVTKIYATGDMSGSNEFFEAFVEENQLNSQYSTDYDDCIYHEVDSNIDISSYIFGKNSFELRVDSSYGTDIGTCPDTAIKVKWCLDLSSGSTIVETNEATNVQTDSVQLNGILLSLGGASSVDVWFRWGEDSTLDFAYDYCDLITTSYSFGYGDVWYAQTFTPPLSYKITSIKLKLGRWGLPGDVDINIRATDGDGHPTGSNLLSQTINGNFLPTESIWYEITFGTDYTVSAGTKYAIEVKALSGSSDNAVLWGYTTGCDYNGGNSILVIYSSFNDDENGDQMFEIWGSTYNEAPIPHETRPSPGSFSAQITGLSERTTYYFRAIAETSAGIFYGDELSFTTLSFPAVITFPATNVEETSAILNGYLDDNGGELCDVGFNWGDTAAYGNSIWLISQATTEDYFFYTFTEGTLEKGKTYHFQAKASNIAGSGYGSDLTFITKPDPPTNLTAAPISPSQIDLSWIIGGGTVNTMVRRGPAGGACPTSPTDETQVYYGTDASVNDTGLAVNTTYCYRAWSEASEEGLTIYSDGYAEAIATTLPTLPDTIIDSGPDSPTNEITPTLTFHGTNSPTSYQCQLNGGGWSECTSPRTYPVSQGTHTFEVKAINVGGEDPTPASWTWLVDTTDPVVTAFDVSPTSLNIDNPQATISWTVTDSGGSHVSHVEVWRTVDLAGAPDDTQWQKIGPDYPAPADSDSWSSSVTDSPSDGTYWYGTHVADEAGNSATELTPVQVTVDKTPPPSPTCDPPGGDFINSITVTCSCSETGTTIRYTTSAGVSIPPTTDSPEYTAPLTLTDITILTVASWDSAGNRSTDKSYTYIITIDTTAPTTAIKIFRISPWEDVTGAEEWLKADDYTIQFEDEDSGPNPSGLKSCGYYVYDTQASTYVVSFTPRTCGNWSFNITAGTSPYDKEGAGVYLIYTLVIDNADLSNDTQIGLNFDFTPPETWIE